MLNFGRTVLASGLALPQEEGRRAAEKASLDRGDENTRIVREAAWKVFHEIHRMMGLLRFSKGKNGSYIAGFEPDHFILPGLGEYFTSRFGENTAWSIIDEKRGLVLSRKTGGAPAILRKNELNLDEIGESGENDQWAALWKHYTRL
jgi:probable DNA metabolism protein